MGVKGIQRFRCSRCPHRLTYLKGEPRQEGYISLVSSIAQPERNTVCLRKKIPKSTRQIGVQN